MILNEIKYSNNNEFNIWNRIKYRYGLFKYLKDFQLFRKNDPYSIIPIVPIANKKINLKTIRNANSSKDFLISVENTEYFIIYDRNKLEIYHCQCGKEPMMIFSKDATFSIIKKIHNIKIILCIYYINNSRIICFFDFTEKFRFKELIFDGDCTYSSERITTDNIIITQTKRYKKISECFFISINSILKWNIIISNIIEIEYDFYLGSGNKIWVFKPKKVLEYEYIENENTIKLTNKYESDLTKLEVGIIHERPCYIYYDKLEKIFYIRDCLSLKSFEFKFKNSSSKILYRENNIIIIDGEKTYIWNQIYNPKGKLYFPEEISTIDYYKYQNNEFIEKICSLSDFQIYKKSPILNEFFYDYQYSYLNSKLYDLQIAPRTRFSDSFAVTLYHFVFIENQKLCSLNFK
jgi:hypothetical protein